MRSFLAGTILLSLFMLAGCDIDMGDKPKSATGVSVATATVVAQINGLTVEQENIKKRLELENKPGSIKHFYLFSAYSGQCLLYSTVKGKVTSSGKRLTPLTVAALDGTSVGNGHGGFPIDIGGTTKYTAEVLQDDGTYGSSIDYLYWFDSRGIYHQQYVAGGVVIHVSDQPLNVKSVIINIENQTN